MRDLYGTLHSMDFELKSVSEDIFLPPTLTIFVAHSLPSAFKVAKALSSLLSLGILKNSVTLNSLVSIQWTKGLFIREKIGRGLHKTRKEPFIRVWLILGENCSYKWFTA